MLDLINGEPDQSQELKQDNKTIYYAITHYKQVSIDNNFTAIKMFKCLL